jgi:hypothetical protein
MPKQYILFNTESLSSPGWEERSFSHTGALTSILAEHYNYSNKPLPKLGDRLREFAHFEESIDPKFLAASTHVRWGDWEVVRVERFKPIDESEYDEFVVCYCHYSLIELDWRELPDIQVLPC